MKILFLGDSITDVGRDRTNPGSLGQGYPLLIGSRLGADFPGQHVFRNTGISGNRIVDLYARIKLDCWNWQPDVLSALVGINDVWHDLREDPNGVDADRFRRVYRMLAEDTLERLPGVTLLLMEPFVLPGTATQNNWPAFAREVFLRAQAVRDVAEQFGACFLPLQGLLDEACKRCPPEHWLMDGVHPTPAGHQLIADAWMDLFRREIVKN
ncbi:MAG: SGNH/GDSL hydrolase family protein [Oscillospiraceae bacterium]|nr:SGNH/GDSL hydrolase family protein [Oscillospiraceae bacterium]